ncbi:DNA-binding transcriptional regulator, MocR family, contains an aminotransferase domain [Flavobacterium glycines]|uniref:DNA-binding transcriptional regulator, MocR family, contains an aminotransferase domain n=1 Tax=Flavobacterium glycines TaxID=551990 RepID=A0A1B9DGY8_9FLAO|nr:PLP-dependent aminotransferase family protein [Flavobacterium glycines]OCB68974.1 GntR family transcriptional regulator [Flavobacterium glycines]GEL10955.1 GntR family transcriptional regulator [Flavobacterium glycines]SDJ34908.1 DNA-binding transcriptional regulator, MocR family, contains an aminotransferase domain [Flavobacterium glycines]
MPREILYLKIAKIIEEQIASGTLQTGDKVPSIRMVQKIHNVSINTVKQAFLELESKSLIASKPKSGYYVSQAFNTKLGLPSINKFNLSDKEKTPEDLISKVFNTLSNKDFTQFSLGVVDKSMLPIAKLNKGIIKVLRNLEDSGTAYEPAQGNINLRRNIAKWSFTWDGHLNEDDIVTTSGTLNALFYSLITVTNPGDTVAIESPVYFGILQMIKSLGLHIIELPTHPVTGVAIEDLKKVLPKIKACCFVTNFNNPLGSCIPEENKKEIVRLLTLHNIPLIEDDLYGDIFFGTSRPKPCKAFDEAGIVMWCGSVSKTLAPGYRVGWVAPGKFKDKLIRHKLLHTMSSPPLFQEVIADFMEHGRYDHHLRSLRNTLYANYLHFQRTIENYFPENTKISKPQGGFVLWLELDPRIDTAILYDTAVQHKIGFAPGRMFTQHNQYNNCMRLNFAVKWDEKVENSLKRLGTLIKQQLKK